MENKNSFEMYVEKLKKMRKLSVDGVLIFKDMYESLCHEIRFLNEHDDAAPAGQNWDERLKEADDEIEYLTKLINELNEQTDTL